MTAQEKVQGSNLAQLKTAASLKVNSTLGCEVKGSGPEPGAAADRRPREGENVPLAAQDEPGAAEVRRPLKVKSPSP
jgi:hypothetical protein